MKLKELQEDPRFKIEKFFNDMNDDDVFAVSQIHKLVPGVTRNLVHYYIGKTKPPMHEWHGKMYVGTKKSIKEFKKLVGGKEDD